MLPGGLACSGQDELRISLLQHERLDTYDMPGIVPALKQGQDCHCVSELFGGVVRSEEWRLGPWLIDYEQAIQKSEAVQWRKIVEKNRVWKQGAKLRPISQEIVKRFWWTDEDDDHSLGEGFGKLGECVSRASDV